MLGFLSATSTCGDGDSAPYCAVSLTGPRSPHLSLAFRDDFMRRDDPNDDKIWLRSERISLRDAGWYVATREGDLGPFPLLEMAFTELNRYIRKMDPRAQKR